jgi:hypothetical protein
VVSARYRGIVDLAGEAELRSRSRIEKKAGQKWSMAENDMNVPDQVMLAFEFDEADLVANRAGQLTEKQRHALKPNVFGYFTDTISTQWKPVIRVMRLSLDVLAILEWVVFTAVALASLWVPNEVNRGISLFLLLVAAGTAIWWLIYRRTGRNKQRHTRLVSTTEGIIQLEPGTHHKPPQLRLNRRQFVLSDAQMKALASGQPYRLYFVDKVILSMESSGDR